MADVINHQHFKVPREDRSLLAIPPLESAGDLVERNRRLFAAADSSFHGRTLAELRSQANAEVLAQARAYTSSLLGIELPKQNSASIIVSGHQPEMFHVGVWAKNFTLASVARKSGAAAINLVIDNDTMNGTSLRVPAGSRDRLQADRVFYDAPQPVQPWEEATVRDPDLFNRFGSIVCPQVRRDWGFEPLIGRYWKAAVQQRQVSNRICDALTAMRARIERDWGLTNLELPMSRLCEMESFQWFAAHLMVRAADVYSAYNQSVAAYRRMHQLRNHMQPVPDLEQKGDWYESPFWIWNRGDAQRGRLFVRQSGNEFELRNEDQVVTRFAVNESGTLTDAVRALREFSQRGIRLRTRALTTTLFARVFLADLFVHGIGGAKYDEMTNQLCHRLFGLAAPEFLTVSATLYLPLGGTHRVTDTELRSLNQRIRDLNYNPDRHLGSDAEIAPIAHQKSQILAEAKAFRATTHTRARLSPTQHRMLEDIRSSLRKHAEPIRQKYDASRRDLQNRLAANSLLKNREFAFALYPEQQVREFLLPLAERG